MQCYLIIKHMVDLHVVTLCRKWLKSGHSKHDHYLKMFFYQSKLAVRLSKLSLCLSPRHESVSGSDGTAPRILNLSTRALSQLHTPAILSLCPLVRKMDGLGCPGCSGEEITAPARNHTAVPVHNPSPRDWAIRFPVITNGKVPQTGTIKACRCVEVQLHALSVSH
jgi:hypothetical protein